MSGKKWSRFTGNGSWMAMSLVALAATIATLASPEKTWAGMLDPTPIEVGSGDARSLVQIDLSADDTVLFDVSYEPSAGITTFDLLSILDTELGDAFFLHAKDFGGSLGQFVFGLGHNGQIVDDDDEDFSPGSWTYWTRESIFSTWESSIIGISVIQPVNGDWHGFNFGAIFPADPPRNVPEPTTLLMLSGAAALLLKRKGSRVAARMTCSSLLIMCICCFSITSQASAAIDPWADTVVSYTAGTNPANGFTDDPSVVLGQPTRDTSPQSPFGGQVSGFNAPFATDEILSIGAGGELIVRFDQPIEDNPIDIRFGIDFLIFGNAFYAGGDTVSGVAAEPGRIQVSQTGESESWFDIPDVFADGLFPTEGYRDATGPFAGDGVTPSDFTLPVNPSLDPTGMTYDEIVTAYAGSGGGAGVDFASTGLSSIQYVRIFQDAADDFSTEIDAFVDVPGTIVPEPSSIALIACGLFLSGRCSRRWGQ